MRNERNKQCIKNKVLIYMDIVQSKELLIKVPCYDSEKQADKSIFTLNVCKGINRIWLITITCKRLKNRMYVEMNFKIEYNVKGKYSYPDYGQ